MLLACVVIGVVLGVIVPYGTYWLAQNGLGMGDPHAEVLALAAPCVLFFTALIWLTIRQPAYPDGVETSETETAQWQALLDEPVPLSEDDDAAMARRMAARRAQRRKR